MLTHCSACGSLVTDNARACPGCGHPPTDARSERFKNPMLGIPVLAASALHTVFSTTGDGAFEAGAFIGDVLGCILLAVLIYSIVWLIRGRKHGLNSHRLVLKIALVLTVLTTVSAVLKTLQHPSPISPAPTGPTLSR